MSGKFDLDAYKTVAERLAEFRAKHPEGSLQPADLTRPYRVETLGSDVVIVYTAAAYRSADDGRPGIGVAQEIYPGRTPYTRGSELQNAETSAWGRAIVAALASDTSAGIASREEVRNRARDAEAIPSEREVTAKLATVAEGSGRYDYFIQRIDAQTSVDGLRAVYKGVQYAGRAGVLTADQVAELLTRIGDRQHNLTPKAGA